MKLCIYRPRATALLQFLPFLLTLFVAPAGTLTGQDFSPPKPVTRLYAVPAGTVEALGIRGGEERLDLRELPDLGEGYPDTIPFELLPEGHYLRVRIAGERANAKYFNTYRHSVAVGERGGRMSVKVYDGEGRFREDATVLADGKPVRYREKWGAYERRDWRVDYLTVVVDRDTLFYPIEEAIDRSRVGQWLRRARYSTPGYVVLTPYRWVRNSIRYASGVLRYGDWDPRWYPFKRHVSRLFNPRENIVGYVTTSQPKYRPGDSIRLTVYLSKPKGRPLHRDSLEVVITEQRRSYGLSSWRRKIGRTEKGTYTLTAPVDPSWELDKTYSVSFDWPGSGFMKRHIEPSITFELTDYELDEYELSATASPDARLPGSAWLDVRAEDVNGLGVPEGRVEVLLLLRRFGPGTSDRALALPDTLYRHEEPTDGRRESRILLPDSLFPPGHQFIAEAHVRLRAPGGETQLVEVPLTVDRNYASFPALEIDGPDLVYRVAGEDSLATGVLVAVLDQNTERETPRASPGRVGLNHQYQAYRYRYADREAEVTLTDLQPTPGPPARLNGDTLTINFPNPHHQPVGWTVTGDAGGGTPLTPEADGLLTGPNIVARYTGFQPGETISLSYRYLAGGTWQHRRQTLAVPARNVYTEHPNVLALELEQPGRARPGETVDVRIRATDHRGRPAPGVRLTAGAVNARFADLPVKLPTYLRKTRKSRAGQEYKRGKFTLSRTATPVEWMLARAGVDTALYYRLRYPRDTFHQQRDFSRKMPGDLSGGHIAPFLVKEGAVQAVRTVYVDERLVYFGTDHSLSPYSIPVDTGTHTLEIRGTRNSYTKAVRVASRTQLVTSFDVDRAAQAGWRERELTDRDRAAELKLLYSRLFVSYNPGSYDLGAFRRRPGEIIQRGRARAGSANVLGLVRPGDNVEYYFAGPDTLRIPTEPGVRYQIREGRDRLYPFNEGELLSYWQAATRRPGAPGIPEYALPTKVRHRSRRVPRMPFEHLPNLHLQDERGRLQVSDLPEELTHLVIAPAEYPSIISLVLGREQDKRDTTINRKYYRLSRRQEVVELPPAQYELLYFLPGDTVRSMRIDLRRDSILRVPYNPAQTEYAGSYSEYLPVHVAPPPADISYQTSSVGRGLTGIILDEATQEPLIGATVLIEGTTFGAVTDFNGRFSLRMPQGHFEISVSYTGYESTTIITGADHSSRHQLVIELFPATDLLEEVVVVGYGTQGKRNFTSAASVVIRSLNARSAGVVVTEPSLNTGVEAAGISADAPLPVKTRANFADAAGYTPRMTTDGRGEATFRLTYPDDVTAWNTFAVGQDRRRRIGFAQHRSRAYLPFQAQLYLPRFLVEGDRGTVTGLAINRTGVTAASRLEFSGDGAQVQSSDLSLAESHTARYALGTTPSTDSLTFQLTLRETRPGGESDGEERTLPVYPRGVEMVAGRFLRLGDTAVTITRADLDGRGGDVTLQFFGNRLDQLTNDLEYIIDYPYQCAEQTASRLLGLLAKQRIDRARGLEPADAKSIRKSLLRLRDLRRPDGGYGWWEDSEQSSPWMTLHILRALRAAADEGYAAPDLAPVHRYLLNEAPNLPERARLQAYLSLAEHDLPPTNEEMANLDTLPIRDDYTLLATSRLHQLRGDTIDLGPLLAASTKHFGAGRYWGDQRFGWYRQPLTDRLACNLLAIRIFSAAARPEIVDETVAYLLGQAPTQHLPGHRPHLGTNTLESAKLVDGILPVLLEEGELLEPARVQLSGTRNGAITTFPKELTLSPAEAAGLTLQRFGTGPSPVAYHQRYFEDQPTPNDNGYEVTTRLLDARDRPLSELTVGETAYLTVTVTAEADADYALIELPIPAGCSYQNRNEYRGRHAVHREYRRDRVAIFCDQLPAGSHTYRVALEPRFEGTYTLNPARVELQYLPVVNGNNGITSAKIGGD